MGIIRPGDRVNTVDRMLGRPRGMKPFTDTDGDGVPNILDCEPLNPKKQGLSHRLARRAAKFIPGKKLREEAESAISHREQVADARREARRGAELSAVKETETFRIETREKRKRDFIKGGGFGGAFSRGITTLGKLAPPAPRPATRMVAVKAKKGKKGKKAKRATATVRPTLQPQPQRIEDLKFNF